MTSRPVRAPDHDEDSLVAIAARRAARRLRADAGTPQFGRLLAFQASGAAGDTMVAVALAGSLFFSVPEATARERVALYLLLTMAPFAIVAPLLSRVLDRHGAGLKVAMLLSGAGRGALAWLLATRLDSLLLFPIAFGVLMLSRVALVARGAVLPHVVPEGRPLVAANATLTKIAGLAGVLAAGPALGLIRWPGARTELLVAAAVYFAGLVPAARIPANRDRRARGERELARAEARSVSIRQAVVAVAGLRLLSGFLVFHLAFALRREDLGTIALGVLIGAAAAGGLLGAVLAPRMRRLSEEGILTAGLLFAGAAGVAAGSWFSMVAAGALALAYGITSGAMKVSFDAIVQRSTPDAARGWAFARFEATLQLAWVVGAAVPLIAPIPGGAGIIGAGGAAIALALLYAAGRRRSRSLGLS